MCKYLTSLLILLYLNANSQKIGCIDSIENYHLTSPNLRADIDPNIVADNLNNVFIQVDTMNNSGLVPNIGIVKLNPNNQIVFSRIYSQQNNSEKYSYNLSFSDALNDLII